MPKDTGRADVREMVRLMSETKLIDLKMPMERFIEPVSKLEQVAGYVFVYEKYVFVVADRPAPGDVVEPRPVDPVRKPIIPTK